MIEGPEVEAHRHKTGHSHVDLILGSLAVVLSLVSVAVSWKHGRTMEQLVEANTWPNLSYSTGNAHDGARVITLALRNTGVGPARVENFEVFYKGKAQPNAVALLHACCTNGKAVKTSMSIDDVQGVVMPARDEIDFMSVPAEGNAPEIWQALNRERFAVRVRACYCSVFDECWVMDSDQHRPRRVHECAPEQATSFQICGEGTTLECQ